MTDPANQFCRRTRREFLWQAGGGFAGVALSGLLAQRRLRASDGDKLGTSFVNPLAPKPAMVPAKAKAVICLFMYGGPSHIDTFDHKP